MAKPYLSSRFPSRMKISLRFVKSRENGVPRRCFGESRWLNLVEEAGGEGGYEGVTSVKSFVFFDAGRRR